MASPGNKLKVRVIRAEGLQRMNKFTSDHPYVTCGIKRADGKVVTKADTKPVMSGDKLNPIWDEMLELESWQPGETLEFTVYDRGLLGSKTEGKAELPAESFHPHGFQGMRPINGLPDAKLFVEVQAVGAQDGEPPSEQDPGLPTYGAVEVQAVGAQDGEPPSAQYPELATSFQDEMLELESWQLGETLEFTVYDRGLLGSKTEGKALLPSEFFYPNGFQGMIAIIGLPDAKLSVEVQIVGAQSEEASPEQDPALTTDGAGEAGENVAVPQRLGVSILQAHGLNHMNNFTGDNPYVTCEVKHLDPAAEMTRVETEAVAEGDTSNPFWGETHTVEPWFAGESLEFTVYDKGLV
eukprot:CAMPEP_0172936816 /NCGR_PEP_ID=MMETSP1075-20121228/222210_1 /TAXON_ID=2916 /ORGANISM="Ceratium fusus, Strain PA161109" /LENGTH=351 /DNA_ID=CAMNT_0013798189 /DNA_START=111 /DNA_END=1164 /DNA_ORIENTATION=+